MTSRVILSALGSDRPGLTQALADAVYSAGGNWLESHLSRLGGKYVGAVLIEIDAAKLEELEQAITAVDAIGLHVSLIEAGSDPAERSELLTVELVGQDRPGIVREVSTVLAGLGVNIEELSSSAESGAWSGERLFRLKALLSIPEGLSPDQVRAVLEGISGEIMVDFTVAAARS
jgi:glycine cleavage system regulatory protein